MIALVSGFAKNESTFPSNMSDSIVNGASE